MAGNRPLSPHLQVYRPQITSVLSILHRITGVGLSFGTILLVAWLVALASGADSYENIQGFMSSWFGLLLMFGWSWATFFHLCTGIRHLIWDTGIGFEKEKVAATGWMVVIFSSLLTVMCWALALMIW